MGSHILQKGDSIVADVTLFGDGGIEKSHPCKLG